MSCGEEKLLELLREFFPGQTILREYAFSNGMRMDFYLPEENLVFEYDGRQHFEYISHFHGSKSNFYYQQNRDIEKEYICNKCGINVIRFNYKEKLTFDLLKEKYVAIGPGSGNIELDPRFVQTQSMIAKWTQRLARKKARQKYKESDAYKEKKEKAREWRKQKRLEIKAGRGL
jgi:very-short-patch-repair endonuclease